jgi:hypothetical protein
MLTPSRLCRVALLVIALLFSSSVLGQDPLHERIDSLIAAGTPSFARLAAPLADDAEFCRRVYLDLTGTIPTAAEARTFFADPSPDKRQKLIDRLLGSPEHARHMAEVLDTMLMERRPQKAVPVDAWREYLRQSIQVNKPWDQLAREILSADGADPKTRPASCSTATVSRTPLPGTSAECSSASISNAPSATIRRSSTTTSRISIMASSPS